MKIIIYVLSIFISIKVFALNEKDLIVVSESIPPLIYLNDEGKEDGVLVDRVKKILRKIGAKEEILIQPWARSYDMSLKKEGVMIFPLASTPDRDKLFKYIGVIHNSYVYFYKLKSRKDIKIKTFNDAKKYSVGVERGDYKYEFLINKGFTKVEIANSDDLNFLKLFGSRVDLLIAGEAFMKEHLNKLGKSYSIVEKIYKIKEIDSRRYLAIKKSTPDEIVEKLRKIILSVYKEE